MSYDASKFVFVDTETTGLNPREHQLWEVAVIAPNFHLGPEEFVWQLPQPPGGWTVDIRALAINRMVDRYTADSFWPEADPAWPNPVSPTHEVRDRLAGRHIVGAHPMFDMQFLATEFTPAWHHRPVCVEAMTMAFTGDYVRSLKDCCELLGIKYDPDQAHGSLYDARLARQVFETIMGEPV